MDLRRLRTGATVICLSAAAGALAGFAVALGFSAFLGGLSDIPLDDALYLFGLGAGAVLGTLLGPLAAFGFLRHVPLSRLFPVTIIGAALGGVIGLFAITLAPEHDISIILTCGAAGFFLAAGLLWYRFSGDARGESAGLP